MHIDNLHPPPRTVEDIAALPEGGGFGMREEIINGTMIRRPIAPDLVAFWIDDTTPMGYIDADGVLWKLARYADGRWVRRRA